MKPQQIENAKREIENLFRQWPEIADDDQLKADMLEGSTDLNEIMTNLIRADQAARMMRDATKARREELKLRADRYNHRAEIARQIMLTILNVAALRKMELPEATVYLKNNAPQVVGDPDPAKLPDNLVKIERRPDKAAILEALKQGHEIEGAQLSNQPPSVVVTIR